jgi:Ca-activated chloride channel family protein
MRRSFLLSGLSATLACAASPIHVPQDFVLPEPDLPPAAPADPRVAHVPPEAWSQAQTDDPVRDVVYTEPGELPRFEFAGETLPLRSTAVRAHLRGPVAEVVVTQRFVNDRPTAIEAIYTFPLPENSAVDRMRMVLGERVIEAQIRERRQAQQDYQRARAAGHTAALLEQERPNVFTQSVANIPPGEAIDVELRYLQTLSYDAGEYEFVFPTVIGPRYIPGTRTGTQSGTGRLADTDRVPDASRITPPTVGLGQRTGNDLTIEVIAEAGSPITAWAAPAHDVLALAAGERLHVKLAAHDRIPNRDFVLRYRSAGARPAARMFVAPDQDGVGGHFLLVAEPPRLDIEKLVGQRELIFVVDVSGSMNGAPLALAKAAMREALAGVRPVDTFDVFVFSGATGRLFDAPRPATGANLQLARDFIDGLRAGGGTEMGGAVAAALASQIGAGRHRYVFFLTDGNTGEEEAIARDARALVQRQKQAGTRARVFGVGIGSSPNTHLLAQLSRAGDGVPLSIHRPLEVARAVQTFERIIDAPILTDVAVAWDTIKVDAVYPNTAPDLFASRPLVLHGRYDGKLPQHPTLALRGAVGPQSVTVPITVTPVGERTDVLGGLWARARVDDLELIRTTDESHTARALAEQDILATGLEHHLVTAFTSLIAVDTSRSFKSGTTIVQPTEIPEGVDPALYGTTSTSHGVTIKLDELRNIPVGGTSRDFTAVVELAPTATRDAAGIRLSGTTGAESKFIVDGADASAFGSAASTDLTRAAIKAARGPAPVWTGLPVEPHVRIRIHSVTARSPAAAAALRTNLTDALADLDRCFLDAAHADRRIHRKLELMLRIGSDHKLLDLIARAAKPLSAEIQTCLRGNLERIANTSALPPGDHKIDLRVWMRF